MPWTAINAATALIAQSRNKEGLECLQRALTQKHAQHMLEDRSGWRRPEKTSRVEEGKNRYITISSVLLPEVDEYSWSFLHPFLIATHPQGLEGNNLCAVCAVAVLNMGIVVHRESFAAFTYPQRCELLERAKLMYMRAEDLLLDEAPELDPDESLFEIFLTVYTNLTEIDMELGNFNDVKAWLDDLDDCVDCFAPWDDSPVYLHFRDVVRFFRRDMITAKAA